MRVLKVLFLVPVLLSCLGSTSAFALGGDHAAARSSRLWAGSARARANGFPIIANSRARRAIRADRRAFRRSGGYYGGGGGFASYGGGWGGGFYAGGGYRSACY